MKKIIYLLLSIFVFTSCNQDEEILDVTLKSKQDKVTICHYDSDSDTWNTINVNGNALKAHLGHGDRVGGGCGDYTYVPDDRFENRLIHLGYDDVLDDYILTENINTIESILIASGSDDIENQIQDLTGLEDFIALKGITTYFCYLGNLNLKPLTSLEYLDFREGTTIPEDIDFSNNSVTSIGFTEAYGGRNLGFTNNPALKSLYFMDKVDLVSVDISNNPALENLGIFFSPIEYLDLSNNPALTSLSLITYGIENLDLSNNTALKGLTITGPTRELDLSNNPALEYLQLWSNNYLTSLNIKNGNKEAISTFEIWDAPNLFCIEVDDPVWSTANWTMIDPWTSFSESCSSMLLAKSINNEIKELRESINPRTFNTEHYKNYKNEVKNFYLKKLRNIKMTQKNN